MEKRKRVAVYIRVSTSHESQENSVINQRSYFKGLIERNPNYRLVDFYIDEGKTGTKMDSRFELQRLISDCEAEKIDLIFVKSISRFARNTLDLLSVVDKMTDLGVEIIFDQENISSFDSGGRFLLTVLAGLAEQESRSISENIRWAVGKLHDKGLTSSHIRALGYGWDKQTKNCYIIEEEAKVVRCIYAWHYYGYSIKQITDRLNQSNIKGIRGSDFTWQTVNRILHNPLHQGKLRIGNKVVQGRHEAIILDDDFLVQQKTTRISHTNNSLPKLYCAYCGSHMRRLGGHYRAKGREDVHVFRCISCEVKPSIPEDELYIINQKMWGLNYQNLVQEKVRKYSIEKEKVYIHLSGSNQPYEYIREERFRGKKVYR